MSSQNLEEITIAMDSAPVTLSIVKLVEAHIDKNDGSTKSLETMRLLLNHENEILRNMDKSVASIMKDGKLDAGDIPDIILLFKNTANLYSTQLKNLKVTRGELIQLIRDILILVLSSNEVEIKNKDIYVKIIQSATALLESSIDLDETVICRGCGCFPSRKKKQA